MQLNLARDPQHYKISAVLPSSGDARNKLTSRASYVSGTVIL